MGMYNHDVPGRAGTDVAKFDGWAMVNIINHYVNDEDLTNMFTRIQFRRALLVSDECKRFQRKERVDA